MKNCSVWYCSSRDLYEARWPPSHLGRRAGRGEEAGRGGRSRHQRAGERRQLGQGQAAARPARRQPPLVSPLPPPSPPTHLHCSSACAASTGFVWMVKVVLQQGLVVCPSYGLASLQMAGSLGVHWWSCQPQRSGAPERRVQLAMVHISLNLPLLGSPAVAAAGLRVTERGAVNRIAALCSDSACAPGHISATAARPALPARPLPTRCPVLVVGAVGLGVQQGVGGVQRLEGGGVPGRALGGGTAGHGAV
jgi:hypothetical protein